jgi:xylulokinase
VDPSNASSVALLDPRARKWSGELLDAVELDPGLMAPVVPSTEPIGAVTEEFAAATGLARSTLVVVGCGDEMAATLGAGVRSEGEVCDVVGTAEPVCAASAEPHADRTMLVECHPHGDPDAWLMENPGFVSGGNLRWFRDQLGGLEREVELAGGGDAYDLLCREAAGVPPGCDGLVFLPCMQGAMAPEWNGAARGVFFGLTLAHTRAHLVRAVLEGSAYALRDILEAMAASGLEPRRLTIVGGGAKGPLWRQIKADVTGLPVRVPESVETTAAGAAMLAAVGAGLHPSCAEAAERFVSFLPEEHEPHPEASAAYEAGYALYRDVYDAAKPVFERHATA